jgi:hypothetical protein
MGRLQGTSTAVKTKFHMRHVQPVRNVDGPGRTVGRTGRYSSILAKSLADSVEGKGRDWHRGSTALPNRQQDGLSKAIIVIESMLSLLH